MNELESRKKQLEELRNFYKPIEYREIDSHARKYEIQRNNKIEELKRVREKSIADEKEFLKNLKYKPNADFNTKLKYQRDEENKKE